MGILEKFAKFISPGLASSDEVRAIVADEIKRARMAIPITANYDPKGEGYRRLTDFEDRVRDLIPVSQDRMIEIGYFMWDNSLMFKRLAKMDKTFLFAEPVTVTSSNDAVKEIVDDFWDDPANRMALDFPDQMMWLGILGEQCWPVDVNPVNGHVSLGYTDPSMIDEVLVSNLNVKQAMQVRLKGSGGRPGDRMSVIRTDRDPASKAYGRLSGECFYTAINKPPNAARGRSDFLTLYDWIDALERHGYNFLERAEFLLNYIWDVTLKGMTREEIKEWQRDNPPPKSGSVRAHNENVTWDAVAPDLKAGDFKSGFDALKSFIMGGHGRPDSWWGEGGKSYQTEADLLGLVPMKDLDERQLLVQHVIQAVVQFVVDQAVIAKRLSEKDAGEGFTVNLPEISKKDLTKLINGVPQLVTGLKLAEESRWITRRTAAAVFASALNQMGGEVDVDAELDELGEDVPADEVDYE